MIAFLAISFTTFIATINLPGTDAHGYLKSPRSRNYVANRDGKWSGGTTSDPKIETCPHCLNQGGICGTTGNNNYNTPLNTFGDPMPVNIQGTFQQGQEIELTSVITAHHKGHFEYKACPIQPGEVPTQACFDAYPLEFVEDKIYNAPKDTNYPERAYIPESGNDFTHTFKLPANLSGDLVLIQWVYVTANSCLPPGYHDYPFPPGFPTRSAGNCGSSLGEQFWNCAEVRIVPSNPTPVTMPVATPTNLPVSIPTSSPVVNPTSSPVSTPTLSPNAPVLAGSDSRLIAYLGNWQTCPSLEETSKYTHIVIAFAVTYTWNPTKNQCSESCTIGSPVPICNNQNNQALVDSWKAAGKKVILSFGGAGMGGSWAGDVNDCWEYCFGKEESVIDQLDTIVRAQNFDGIDIDYEYFYNTVEAQNFLRTVTTGLRSRLPLGNIVTHAPMDPDLIKNTAYYNILKEVSSSLDFIMPQYYNGFTRPAIDGIDGTGSGSISALSHYDNLVNDMFNGDATKIIFGFCISDCSGTGSNANAMQAASVMSSLREYYPCNGGAFFWVAAHDTGGSWSQIVSNEILPYSGCSDNSPISPSPTTPPTTPAPTFPLTAAPTLPPVPTTSSPTQSPVQPGMCPSGYSGMIATIDCKGFYHCQNGSLISNTPTMCQAGLLFSETLQVCDWSYNVVCQSNPDTPIPTLSPTEAPTMAPVATTSRPTAVPTLNPVSPTAPPTSAPVAPTFPPVTPTSSPTGSPVKEIACPPQYTGLIPANGCTEFYDCFEGSLVSNVPIYCPEGLLYKTDQICMCNFVFVL